MTRIITVASGKGGVGKTLISTNVSYSLSRNGFRTLLLDFNFTTPHIPIVMPSKNINSLNDFLTGNADFYEILNIYSTLFFISPSLNLGDISYLNLDNLKSLRDKMNLFDFVIIDSAPGFGKEAIISLEFCDEVIIVSNPTLSSYFDSLKCFQIAKNLNKKVLGVIINKFEKNSPVTPKDFEMVEGLPIIGVIKESKMAKISEMRRSLLYDLDRNFKKEIDLIVSKITGFEVRESGVKQKIMNIFSWIR